MLDRFSTSIHVPSIVLMAKGLKGSCVARLEMSASVILLPEMQAYLRQDEQTNRQKRVVPCIIDKLC